MRPLRGERITTGQALDRWPLLAGACQWVAILSASEAGCALRDYWARRRGELRGGRPLRRGGGGPQGRVAPPADGRAAGAPGWTMVMHRGRRWRVARRAREELAELLTSMTWCLCTAMETEGGSVWTNDAISGDGAGEYAMLRLIDGTWRQVESITASWCSREKLLAYAEQADRGDFDALDYGYGTVEASRLEPDHRPCRHCM